MNSRSFMIALALMCAPTAAPCQLAWQARLTPAYMAEAPAPGWTMGILNWLHAGYRAGRVETNVMLSAEPFTLDTQRDTAHPLLMNASVALAFTQVRLSAALVGEPALGPTTYLHRASAALDPVAPATHHLTNAYHAAYAVVTAEVRAASVVVAASAFDSRDRHAALKRIEPHAPDAFSVRTALHVNERTTATMSVASVPAGGHGDHAVATNERSAIGLASIEGTGPRTAWLGVLGYHDVGPGLRLALLETTHRLANGFAIFARSELADALDERITIVINPDGTHGHDVTTLRSMGGKAAAGATISRTAGGINAALGARASLTWIPLNRRELFENQRLVPGVSVFFTIQTGSRGVTAPHH